MKNVRFVSPLALLCAILLLAFAPAASAITAPAVSIADSLGNTILVDGTGAVAYGGNCTPTTCTTSSVSVSTGQTTWAGTIGTFSLTAVIGTTKPYSVPNPSMDLNLQRVTTSSGGTLTIQWTDTDFNYSDIAAATIAAGGVLNGTGTSSYTAYFDNTNAPFGTGIQVGTLGPFPNGAFNGQVTGPGPTASPFSMTEVATVTLGPGGTFGVDYAFVPLPAPLSLKCSAASGQVGVPYNSSLMAIGGIVPYTFSIISGNLPSGLTLNPTTGAITGTPTQAGTFSFTAQVVDSSEGSADTVTSTCTIVITTPPPISLACPMSTGQVGVPYSSALTASGGVPPYTYSIQSGMLPNGLSLNPATGAITGTPTQAGPFSFVGQVIDSTNSAAGTTTSSCGITIASLPTANCVSITAVQGVAITPVTMTASGGTGTGYTFSATGLPSGLTMSSSGTISGTPTVSGTFPYTVTIKDSAGNTGTVNCSVTVAPPVTASCVSITAIQGVAITPVTMTASGGSGSGYTFSATGLPSGLTMSTGGTISGTPTVSGTFPYTVTVTDSAGNTGTVNCSVTVAPPVSASCVSITAVQGVAITPVTMTASGGTGSGYTFSATGLPSGLTMSSSGTISGTPTVSGTFPYTVTIKDSAGDVGTVNCSVTVAPPVTASCVSITAIQGVAITPVTMTASGGSGSGYTFSATGLPSGLTMSSSGTISGTPTVSGTFPYTVTIKDSAGDVGTVNCSVTVAPPVTASCVSITAIQGVTITPVTLTAGGGVGGPYTFSSTDLPAGLSISTSGTISGTPAVSGTFTYHVTIRDRAGNIGIIACSVTVAPPPTNICGLTWGYWKNHVSAWKVTSLILGSQTYNQTQLINLLGLAVAGDASINLAHQLIAAKLNVANGTNPNTDGGAIAAADSILSTFSGYLPYNVSSSSTVGQQMVSIAGELDTFNSDGAGQPGCTNGPAPLTVTCASSSGQVGVAYSSSIVAGGGLAPYTFTIISGALPAGLTLNPSTGAITGTPTTAGTFSFKVEVADSTAVSGSTAGTATTNCSITIAPPPQPLQLSCPSGSAAQGTAYSSAAVATGGISPYTFSLVSGALPTGLTLNSSTGAVTGTPTKAGAYSFSLKVVDSKGSYAVSTCCSISVSGGITTGQFVTYTQGGWGAPPKGNNPGATMTNNFTKVYGSGGVVIGGTYKLTFTNALAITNFLPQGGTPGKLTASATDPGSSAAGVFAGQVLALQLSVDFSNKGITPTGLANLHVVAGPLAGDTVAQVLALANSVLGGGALPTGMAISDLNNVVDAINSNFDSGTSNNGYLQ